MCIRMKLQLKVGQTIFFFNSDFNALDPKSVTDKQQTDRQKADVWYDTVWDHVMIRVQHYCCAVKSGVTQVNQKICKKCRKQRIIPKCWTSSDIEILVKYWKVFPNIQQVQLVKQIEFNVGLTKSAKRKQTSCCAGCDSILVLET